MANYTDTGVAGQPCWWSGSQAGAAPAAPRAIAPLTIEKRADRERLPAIRRARQLGIENGFSRTRGRVHSVLDTIVMAHVLPKKTFER